VDGSARFDPSGRSWQMRNVSNQGHFSHLVPPCVLSLAHGPQPRSRRFNRTSSRTSGFILLTTLSLDMLQLAAFILGTIVGSFANVCIFRIPARQSVVRPRSSCPACHEPIRSYDNIPILSYLILRGHCRHCGVPISLRYPVVEALTGTAALAVFALDGLSPQFPIHFAFVCMLIVVTFIDYDHQIIPDLISLPGIVVGFLASFLPAPPTWQSSLLGIVLGGGILWAVAEGYYWLTRREGMGGGDIKLLAMIGAFLGWEAIPVTLMLASLAGTLVGLGLILFRGRNARMPIPFGPFLAAGAVCALFFGDAILAWYLHLARYSQP
jgi:leader peptidase (prepilin peptidase) / N-methyltransferase